MKLYDFEVLNGDEVIAAARAISLPSPAAAWPRIAQLAKTIDRPGCRIRVTDEDGAMVIMTGVASVMRRSRDTIAA